MPGHYPNPSENSKAQIGLLVRGLLREKGWKILNQPREGEHRPDLMVKRSGTILVIEIKRASEGRRDRVIPLLSQAALEAAYYSRVISGHPIPVAIVGANRILESVAEEAEQFVRERAPEVAVGVLDLEGLRLFA